MVVALGKTDLPITEIAQKVGVPYGIARHWLACEETLVSQTIPQMINGGEEQPRESIRVPERGEIVLLAIRPAYASDQMGEVAVLVMSNARYNRATELALVCPITSKAKRRPLDVEISAGRIVGAVLSDHVRSVSWPDRVVGYAAVAPPDVIARVAERIAVLIAS